MWLFSWVETLSHCKSTVTAEVLRAVCKSIVFANPFARLRSQSARMLWNTSLAELPRALSQIRHGKNTPPRIPRAVTCCLRLGTEHMGRKCEQLHVFLFRQHWGITGPSTAQSLLLTWDGYSQMLYLVWHATFQVFQHRLEPQHFQEYIWTLGSMRSRHHFQTMDFFPWIVMKLKAT